MKMDYYSNRIGGFASVNTGIIKDCYTDAIVKYESNAAGFVFENAGEIHSSFAQNKTIGKKNIGGFCCRNKGTFAGCGWLSPADAKRSRQCSYTDISLAIEFKRVKEIFMSLHLGAEWCVPDENSTRLALNEKAARHHFEINTENIHIIEISNARELFALAADIASGNTDAASSYYKLTSDINLHGKNWIPIGISELLPFTGVFDGCGHTITNFKIHAKGMDYAGFFGYVKEGRIANLNLDCMVHAQGGNTAGTMCAVNEGGAFFNCRVIANISAEKCCGGFIGKNAGVIVKSCFIGKIAAAVSPMVYFLPFSAALILLLAIGVGIVINRFVSPPWSPEIIDPNLRPSTGTGTYTPPPAGSNRISFEMNQEIYINSATQVGIVNYINPKRSTQDVVIRVLISDAELLRTIGKTGRSSAEQAALEGKEGYDAETSYQELYRSGRILIGYELEAIKLAALSDKTYLPVGDYEMIVAIDAYNPDTNEKSVVNAQAPVLVHIVDPE